MLIPLLCRACAYDDMVRRNAENVLVVYVVGWTCFRCGLSGKLARLWPVNFLGGVSGMALSRCGYIAGRIREAGAGWLAGKLAMLLMPRPDTMSSIERFCLSKAERSEILASSGADACGAGSGALERKLSMKEEEDFLFVVVFVDFELAIWGGLMMLAPVVRVWLAMQNGDSSYAANLYQPSCDSRQSERVRTPIYCRSCN